MNLERVTMRDMRGKDVELAKIRFPSPALRKIKVECCKWTEKYLKNRLKGHKVELYPRWHDEFNKFQSNAPFLRVPGNPTAPAPPMNVVIAGEDDSDSESSSFTI